jgi:predicted Rossmann fold nucleotide-binding protein DprA/Smf involved in DNA uptake
MNGDLLYWMLLAHSGSLKPAERLEVIRAANGQLEAFSHTEMGELPENLRQRLRAVWAEVAREGFLLERLRDQNIQVVVGSDPLYPARLKRTLKTLTPLVLYGVGDIGLLSARRTVAIIGSREASPEALEITTRASRYFAREGYVVVSGYAKGVDQAAFEGALGNGKTVAVLPQGILDKSSQAAVRKHTGAVNSGGVLFVSELHPKAVWEARFAMMRNRIVTALADVLIVAQTGLKETAFGNKRKQSGTWNAVQTAKGQGGKVFVLDLPQEGNQAMIAEGLAEALAVTSDNTMFYRVEDSLTIRDPKPAEPVRSEHREADLVKTYGHPPGTDEAWLWSQLEDPANRPRLLKLVQAILEELRPELLNKGDSRKTRSRKKAAEEDKQSPLIPPE